MITACITARAENVPGITGACAIRNITYLARGQWCRDFYDSLKQLVFCCQFPCWHTKVCQLVCSLTTLHTALFCFRAQREIRPPPRAEDCQILGTLFYQLETLKLYMYNHYMPLLFQVPYNCYWKTHSFICYLHALYALFILHYSRTQDTCHPPWTFHFKILYLERIFILNSSQGPISV